MVSNSTLGPFSCLVIANLGGLLFYRCHAGFISRDQLEPEDETDAISGAA